MTEPQSFTLDLENKGLMIARPGDVLPPGYMPSMLNITSNRSGYLQSRPGSLRVSGLNLGGPVHSQGRMLAQGVAYTYQGAGTALYRNFLQVASGFSGNPLFMSDGGPDSSVLPYMIIWDSLLRVKDNGTTLSNFGIAGPMQMASAAATAAVTKTIDLFEYATDGDIQTAWPGSSATPTTNSTAPAEGTKCGNVAVAVSTVGSITKTGAIDLSKFTVAGDSSDSDFISIYLRVDNAAYIKEIRLMFDVDPSTNDFAHNFYWKSVQANIATAASQGTSTASQAYSQVVDSQALQQNIPSDGLESTLPPEELTLGVNQWVQLFIKKSDFTRVGTSVNDWGDVAAIRIQIETNSGGAVNVGVDGLIMQSGDNLDASDYEWIFRYRSEVTGTTSPFSPVMRETVEIRKTNATVTVRNPRDTQATHIELYRRGGDSSVFAFATEKVVTAWTGTTTITDNIPDASLGDAALLGQIELANLSQTPSAIATSVQKTINNGVAYTSYTSAAGDDNLATYADLSSLDTIANGDWLVIGADGPFRQILIALGTGAENVNFVTLTIQYWNGTEWRSVLNPVDGTKNNVARSLGQGGTIEFDVPNDWDTTTINSVAAYYVRLSVSGALSAAVHATEIRIGANAFDPATFEVFNGRVWSNDTRHTDRVWYSERFSPEVFFDTNYVTKNRSGDPVVRPFGLDDQLFVYSNQTVERLIGSSPESFQLIPTATEVGLFSSSAICRGRNRIFHRGYDGIYALPGSGFGEKLSLQVDPIFNGLSSPDGEMSHVDNNSALTEVMEFFKAKVSFGYTDGDGYRKELIYDLELERWEPTDRPATSYLRLDDAGAFYSGSENGYVYQRFSIGGTDQGVAIDIRFNTVFIDFGDAAKDKQITEIVIDCDLAGQSIDFFADFNNRESLSQTAILSNNERGPVYFPIDDDTIARNVSLRVDSNNGEENVKFYKVTIFYIPLTAAATKLPTNWEDLGYPGDKRLQQLQLEIDTQGVAATVAVQVDRQTTETLTVTTSGRTIVPISLAADTIGKLTRLVISSATPFRYFTHNFQFLRDPLQMTRYDTVELDFNWPRFKFIRRLWIAAQTPNVVAVQIYIDGVLRYTSPALLIDSPSGWAKVLLKLPPGLKGKLFRFIFTSTAGFKIFLDQTDVEWHPLATARTYERAQLVPRGSGGG